MFGLSLQHVLILVIILLLFGNRRLPELGESLGRGLRNFKKALDGRDELPHNTPSASSTTASQPETDKV